MVDKHGVPIQPCKKLIFHHQTLKYCNMFFVYFNPIHFKILLQSLYISQVTSVQSSVQNTVRYRFPSTACH